ncbi:DJ-1/PfpI family protein [Alginatibacterium sediminis]|uniref:DJ-1/PfpI family protein n=1 Tax=Alginatibacterium sediminis TaxID=2164068 RepID=A0A420E9S1_9ALTE|nr:DJ-1/PfpI family protein [Alginatibacterium sediminis]RKF17421.1 DJ-1/PfpI family protein [Alginatibacterium sediminis]
MNIAIYIYDDAEVLDFSGPFEVFSTAKRLVQNDWDIFLVAQSAQTVNARGGYLVVPHYSFDNHPDIDLLVVVGGVHTAELEKPKVIDWIYDNAQTADLVASVCTGAFLLAKTGLYDGLDVITHWEDVADLRNSFPKLKVKDNQRWVRQGKFVSSAGISAGIDMSLYLVSELASPELAETTAKQMDYHWQTEPSN